jgi:hypothetical protein
MSCRQFNIITEVVTLFVIVLQVLGKCQLLEAVQEKEQGLDSHGRKLHFIYNLASGVHRLNLINCANRKTLLQSFQKFKIGVKYMCH